MEIRNSTMMIRATERRPVRSGEVTARAAIPLSRRITCSYLSLNGGPNGKGGGRLTGRPPIFYLSRTRSIFEGKGGAVGHRHSGRPEGAVTRTESIGPVMFTGDILAPDRQAPHPVLGCETSP